METINSIDLVSCLPFLSHQPSSPNPLCISFFRTSCFFAIKVHIIKFFCASELLQSIVCFFLQFTHKFLSVRNRTQRRREPRLQLKAIHTKSGRIHMIRSQRETLVSRSLKSRKAHSLQGKHSTCGNVGLPENLFTNRGSP